MGRIRLKRGPANSDPLVNSHDTLTEVSEPKRETLAYMNMKYWNYDLRFMTT